MRITVAKIRKFFETHKFSRKKNDGLIWIYPYATSGAGYFASLTMCQIYLKMAVLA